MAPPRATWKGHLKLSLVSCPVRLYTATNQSERIRFHMLHKDTHNRIQMKPHDPELGAVERADLVKGYEFEKDQYVIVDSSDLDTIQIESSKTITIEQFVDAAEVDPIYLDTPYYITPDGPVAEETYSVIRESMRSKEKAALGRVVLSGRERQVVIAVTGRGFTLTTLRPAKEVRQTDAYFDDIADESVDDEMLGLAAMIIDQHTGPFDPSAFEDRYQEALIDLVKAKVKGEQPVIAKAPERGKVVNLMDALKKSLDGDAAKKPPAKSRTRRTAAKRGGRSRGGRKSKAAG